MLETWFVFIIFSVVAAAVGEIAQKISVTSKDNLSAETINFHIAVLQSILALGFLAATGASFDPALSPSQLAQLLFAGVMSFFFFKFIYTSYKGNSASLSQVIFSLSAFISTVLGILIFRESATIFKFSGVVLIILGVAIASYKKGERLSRYNLMALAAAIIYGFLTSIDKSFATTINPHYYQVLAAGIFVPISLLLAGRQIIKESRQITHISYRTIVISTICFTAFNKLTYLAYAAGGEVGRVDAINNTQIFLIILFEILILKDRTNLKQKILAAVLSVAGIFILGFVK